MGIVCACLPVMRNVLLMLVPPFARNWMSAPKRSESLGTLPLRDAQANTMKVASLPVDSEESLHNNSIAMALMNRDEFEGSGMRSGFQRQLSL